MQLHPVAAAVALASPRTVAAVFVVTAAAWSPCHSPVAVADRLEARSASKAVSGCCRQANQVAGMQLSAAGIAAGVAAGLVANSCCLHVATVRQRCLLQLHPLQQVLVAVNLSYSQKKKGADTANSRRAAGVGLVGLP